ncbi:MAG: DNA-binding protein [Desulfobulbaceae bacterium]
MKHKLLKSALCLCLLLPACDNQKEDTTPSTTAEKIIPATSADIQKTAEQAAETPAPADTPSATADTAQQSNVRSGKVVETMNSGGYTYMNVDTGNAQQWVAVPESEVKVGDEISYHDGMVMSNFTSKSLNKTFDAVVFSSGLAGQEPPQPDAGSTAGADSFAGAVQGETPPAAAQTMTESGGSLGAMAPFDEIKVEKAAGENGYTVEEVFTNSAKLDGKTIRVQGKVIKFSPNIMGMNWIHLQDGTGDPLKSTHDLVITTSAESPKDKETITIEGIVRANKDFGSGYSYVVMVEEAKIVK